MSTSIDPITEPVPEDFPAGFQAVDNPDCLVERGDILVTHAGIKVWATSLIGSVVSSIVRPGTVFRAVYRRMPVPKQGDLDPEWKKIRDHVAGQAEELDVGKIVRGVLQFNSGPVSIPHDAKGRKSLPVATGVIDYFPDALLAVAACSKAGNDQHNPGKPLFWDRSKSTDEADALIRHFMCRGTVDTDGIRHSAKVAWRALALLQKEIEAAAVTPGNTEAVSTLTGSDARLSA